MKQLVEAATVVPSGSSRLQHCVVAASRLGITANTCSCSCSATTSLSESLTMSDEERYLFELHGFLVVPQVLSSAEVAALNAAIDANADKITLRKTKDSLDGRFQPTEGGSAATAIQGEHGRGDFGGFLFDWGDPASGGAAFRSLIAREEAMRIVLGVIGDSPRFVGASGLSQTTGAEGFVLHGGGNPDNMHPSMRERDFHRWESTPSGGRMRNGLVRVGYALSDSLKEHGGFCPCPMPHTPRSCR